MRMRVGGGAGASGSGHRPATGCQRPAVCWLPAARSMPPPSLPPGDLGLTGTRPIRVRRRRRRRRRKMPRQRDASGRRRRRRRAGVGPVARRGTRPAKVSLGDRAAHRHESVTSPARPVTAGRHGDPGPRPERAVYARAMGGLCPKRCMSAQRMRARAQQQSLCAGGPARPTKRTQTLCGAPPPPGTAGPRPRSSSPPPPPPGPAHRYPPPYPPPPPPGGFHGGPPAGG